MELIVHLCPPRAWEQAKTGKEYRGDTLDSEGFIHCSKPGQVLKVANAFFSDDAELIMLWIDPQQLNAELRWEGADGDVFPHIYGPINIGAVFAQTHLTADPDGVFRNFDLPE